MIYTVYVLIMVLLAVAVLLTLPLSRIPELLIVLIIGYSLETLWKEFKKKN